MSKCQLIYFEGCPNAKHARAILLTSGIPFEVILQDELNDGNEFKNYSSPSILKDGKLLLGQKLSSGSSACSFEKIDENKLKAELLNSENGDDSSAMSKFQQKEKGLFAYIGSFGSALTVGLCPICIPAIGTFLSSIGLGFIVSESVLKPVLFIFLFFALFGFFWSYLKEHGNIYPLIAGLIMSVALYIGRYIYVGGTVNLVLMYGGIVGIIGTSIWNWKLRKRMACSSCQT